MMSRTTQPETPKTPTGVLAMNQVTSSLFGDLIDALSEETPEVLLLAGEAKVNPSRGRFRWIRAAELCRTPAWKRIWSWGKFTWQSLKAMSTYRGHLMVITTNPPFVGWVAPLAKTLFGIEYVLVIYDVYPDVLWRMGVIRERGVIAQLLRRLNVAAIRGATRVTTIGDYMRQNVLAQFPRGRTADIQVIPNWADVHTIYPVARGENPFAVAHSLVDKFVVMYSGNFGATHDVESIIDAAALLADLPDVSILLIGNGTRLKHVQAYIAAKSPTNLLLLDWIPDASFCHSVTSADCLVVSLDTGYEGISVPGKTYTSLAAGAAIIAVAPPKTELVDLVLNEKCGIWVPPRSSSKLAEAIRALHSNRALLNRMKANSRAAAEKHYNVEICTGMYRSLIRSVLSEKAPTRGGN